MNCIIHKTRFKELGFWKLGPGCWQVVDLTGDKPAQIGTQYASKDELLANLESYATEYGCEDALPKGPVATFQKAYEGQAHYLAKAAQSLTTLLSGLDYSKFSPEKAACLTTRLHEEINYIDASYGA